MNPETKIEKKTCDLVLNFLGVENSKLKDQGETGFPDRCFWLPGGKPLLIEFKQPGEDPDPKQEYIHNKLKKLGYQVEVCDNEFDGFEIICKALESTRLSKTGCEILDRARRRCAVLRSRAR